MLPVDDEPQPNTDFPNLDEDESLCLRGTRNDSQVIIPILKKKSKSPSPIKSKRKLGSPMKKDDKENALVSKEQSPLKSKELSPIKEQSPLKRHMGMLQEDTNNAVNSPSKQSPAKINPRRLVF